MRGEGLYNILIEFGIPVKLVRVIKISLNETYSHTRLCDAFSIQNGLKQDDALLSLLFNFAFRMCS
jgi:hypothetical protein